MIIHNCIKCDYFEMIPMADKTPCYQKYICPECGEEQYIYHSRIEPKTYPKEMVSFDENGYIKISECEGNNDSSNR